MPHPSVETPQSNPLWAQVSGQHAPGTQVPGVPPLQVFSALHVWPEGHGPQSSVPQQPSLAVPQARPCSAQVLDVQAGDPHWFAWRAPHTWHGDEQAPHTIGLPHPSLAVPQSRPCSAQVMAEQPPPVPLLLTVLLVLVLLVTAVVVPLVAMVLTPAEDGAAPLPMDPY